MTSESDRTVWIVETGSGYMETGDKEDNLIESVWTTQEKAVAHLASLGNLFKYTQVSETWWESKDERNRWIGIVEYELDPET